MFAGIVEKKGKKGKRLSVVDCENVRKCRHLQDACIYYRTLSIELYKHIPQPIVERLLPAVCLVNIWMKMHFLAAILLLWRKNAALSGRLNWKPLIASDMRVFFSLIGRTLKDIACFLSPVSYLRLPTVSRQIEAEMLFCICGQSFPSAILYSRLLMHH